MKLADSLNPATQAENIKKLNAGLEAVDAKTLPGTSTATTGQILKLTGETKTPAWADEYSYTPPAYSETEVNTGKKWVDNNDIYLITIPVEYASGEYLIEYDLTGKNMINAIGYLDTSDRRYFLGYYLGSSIRFVCIIVSPDTLNILSGNNQGNLIGSGYVTIYYTKPDPTPGRAPEDEPEEVKEPEEKKTTKKKTTK